MSETTPTAVDVLLDAFGRIPDLLHDVVDGIDPGLLLRQPEIDGVRNNSIGWIVWHIGRMEDAQVADLAGSAEVHASGGWGERLGVPYPASTHGYGMSADDVSRFSVASADLLTAYYDAVHARTVEVVRGLDGSELSRIVDERWDPPVTALVRLVSVADDAAQHAGQAAYVKGLLGA
ncbi:conserved hypothetical protein [Nostocoides japonicum T1-X7]|uniref:DinB-like domain-containing protein n=1 Tax=Nostocoides japonicum T1-X7 TaxID=1194083 RepID=A0A077LUW4_9MICO|nr:DinB family protein [Tetrasphaera japonica]CCH77693.1 conserved hypothetical protein [Tetrasphaera japonica T1-X7]